MPSSTWSLHFSGSDTTATQGERTVRKTRSCEERETRECREAEAEIQSANITHVDRCVIQPTRYKNYTGHRLNSVYRGSGLCALRWHCVRAFETVFLKRSAEYTSGRLGSLLQETIVLRRFVGSSISPCETRVLSKDCPTSMTGGSDRKYWQYSILSQAFDFVSIDYFTR